MKMKRSFALKLTAGILSVVMLIGAALSVMLWIIALNCNFDTSSFAYIEDQVLRNMVEDHLKDVLRTWRRGDDPLEVYGDTNLIFRLRDENGEILAESGEAAGRDTLPYTLRALGGFAEPVSEDTVTSDTAASDTTPADVQYRTDTGEVTTVLMHVDTTAVGDPYKEPVELIYTLEGDVDRSLDSRDRYSVILPALSLYHSHYDSLLFIAAGFLVLWLNCLCALLCCIGWHRGEDAPRRGWLEWIPYDLLCFGIVLFIALHDIIFWRGDAETVILSCAFIAADSVILTVFLCTTAVRIKTHTLLKTTLIYYVLALVWRVLCWLGRGIALIFCSIPLVWKTALGVLLNGAVDFLAALCFQRNPGAMALYVLVKNAVFGAAILFCAVLMRRIQSGGERLAAGDLNAKIDTRYMFGDFRIFSENMNRLGVGMSAAVEERMKSERFRTELITNVSHDIKTPLTSIVNYVDLMEKENVTEEPLAGYIEVLSRQAARLKKLAEDLVDASKAATGAIAVNPEPLDVTVLLGQTAGEYDEKLRAAKLDLILHQPGEPVMIAADGRLLWRVFDNLMNNITKYALPGTRVYLTLKADADCAEIIFRNITRDELHMESEELLNRFTRGDASRSTEGSGLGLSIANSLTELQGGKLSLHVDGDLFKVSLRFPLAEEKTE